MQDYTLEVEEGQDMMVLDALLALSKQVAWPPLLMRVTNQGSSFAEPYGRPCDLS